MTIRLRVSTLHIDYSGYDELPRMLEITDPYLKLWTYYRYQDEINYCILCHKIEKINRMANKIVRRNWLD